MQLWELPQSAVFGGKTYDFHGDYRDILEIFSYFQNPDLPEYFRWVIALTLFYKEPVPEQHMLEAAQYLSWFIRCGHDEPGTQQPKLLDWEQDAPEIIADVNKVAGQEIRSLPFLHWWTFLSWFHAIGDGQLSGLVSIREKLHRGKKLECWEREYYQRNRDRINLRKKYSASELAEQERLKKLLEGS